MGRNAGAQHRDFLGQISLANVTPPAPAPPDPGAVPILPTRDGAWVDPDHPDASDDFDPTKPFITIQAAIDFLQAYAEDQSGGDDPYSSAIQMRFQTVYVTPGIYDESLDIPGGLSWRLIALGQVTLGDGILTDLGSTVPRDVIWRANSTMVPAVNIKQTLMITTLADGPTGTAAGTYASGWDISGELGLAGGAESGGPDSGDTELHLNQVRVRGLVESVRTDVMNSYFQNCRFDDEMTINENTHNIVLARETRFGAPVAVSSLSRAMWCNLLGDWEVAAIASQNPPNGLIGCQFGAAITWTGPALSFIVDAYTNAKALGSGLSLAGGATKQVIGDLTP